MKLLLLQPPIQDFYETDIRLQPIGLCYLKAAVEKFLPDWKVKIIDFHRGHGRKTIVWPKELRYLKEYYPWPDQSPFSTFHAYYHFGASFEEIVATVVAQQAKVIGISSLFSPYFREVLTIATMLKAALPEVPIIVGGSHVSAMPESMLEHPAVDFIIRGEGERPLVEWLKVWQTAQEQKTENKNLSNESIYHSVPNLGFKDQSSKMYFNDIQDNWPLQELPAPQLNDLDLKDYLFEKKPLSFVITSRSCPHHCSFCSVHNTFGNSYRRNAVERVFSEIVELYERGYRVFDFEDDNLTFYKKEFAELCQALIERFPAGNIQCVAMNGISYLSLDQALLQLMKRAGFSHLNLALVSSDTTVRQTTKRPHTIEKYLQIVSTAFELGFNITSYQILGLPNESLDSMIQTLCFNAEQPVLMGASPFYLTPNSPIAKNFPAPSPEDVFKSRLTAFAIETEHFKREDIYTLLVITRIINFLKGLEFEEPEKKLSNLLNDFLLNNEPPNLSPRTAIGFTLLAKLMEEKKLYASSPSGLRPLKKFSVDVWERVLKKITFIRTQQGKTLHIS